MGLRSTGRLAAVDADDLAGDERRFVGSEKDDRIGDFIGPCAAFERYRRQEGGLLVLRLSQTREHFSLDRSGRDSIDAYAEGGGLEGRDFGEALHRMLTAGVE